METAQKPTEFPTEEEVRLILKAVDKRSRIGKRDLAILRVFIEGGLRRGEVINLNIENLCTDPNGYFLYFECLKKRQEQARKIRRRIPLSTPTATAIINYLHQEYGELYTKQPQQPMFRTMGLHGPYKKRRITPRTIGILVERYVAKAKLTKRLTPHSFRHGLLTRVLQGGFDVETVRAIAGHASIIATQKYLHTDEVRKRAAIEAIAI